MMQGMFPAGTRCPQFLQLNQSILTNPLQIRSDPRTNERTVYFMTSDLMEAQFILKYQVYPLSMECSSLLNATNSLAKIYSRVHANT